jgi:tetratricopeptide (TPR) repeat protein
MARVFISHSSADKRWATEVCEWLRADGHDPFLDSDLREGIAVGEDWKQRLYHELRNVDAVLCIVSKAFVASTWCAAEVGIADERGYRLLPLRVEAGVVHPLMERLQYTDYLADPAGARERTLQVLRSIDAAGREGTDPSAGGRAGRVEPVSVELGGLFEPAWMDRRPSPASLLRPDRGVVRFSGRQDELGSLNAWCAQDEAGPVRLIVAPGGQGKTRLALQVCADRREAGWVAGVLGAGVSADAIGRVADTATPVLLVVDYAEARLAQVQAVLQVLRRRPAAPVRLLLLARSARVEDGWWSRLRVEFPDLCGPVAAEPLAELYPAGEERAAAFRRVVADLAAGWADVSPQDDWPGLAAGLHPPADLADPEYGLALNLHMLALTMLLQSGLRPVPNAGPDREVADVLLDHEQRYWTGTATARGLDRRLTDSLLLRAVVAAVLCGAYDEDEAVATIGRIPRLGGEDEAGRLAIAEWLRDLYPAPVSAYWGALAPGRVAEHLVGQALVRLPGLAADLLGTASEGQLRRGLTVLARAAAHQPHVLALLAGLMTADPHVAPAVAKLDIDDLTAVLDAFPEERSGADTPLLDVQMEKGRILFEQRRLTQSESALESAVRLADNRGETTRARFASLLLRRVQIERGKENAASGALAEAGDVLEGARAVDDRRLAVHALRTRASAQVALGRFGDAKSSLADALRLIAGHGDLRALFRSVRRERVSLTRWGPEPAAESINYVRGLLDAADEDKGLQREGLAQLAVLTAMQGDHAGADDYLDRARAALGELHGRHYDPWFAGFIAAPVYLLTGHLGAAEREFRHSCRLFERNGQGGFLASRLAALADLLSVREQLAEAEECAMRSEKEATAEQHSVQAAWRCALAGVRLEQGEYADARALVDEAHRHVLLTDDIDDRGSVLFASAQVYAANGNRDWAVRDAEASLGQFAAKGNRVQEERVRDFLACGLK